MPILAKLLVPLALAAVVLFSAATSAVRHADASRTKPPLRTLQAHR